MKRLAVPALLAASLLALRAEDKPAPTFRETPPATKAAPPPTLREAVDALPETDLKEFLKIIREHYIGGAKLTETEISRATMQGVLERIAPGASFAAPAAQTPDEQSPFRTEILDNKTGYLRLGALSTDHVGELDTALQTIAARTLNSAILDLRATPPGSDFALAAKVCERFCPKGRVLFTVKRPNIGQEMILTSKEDPRFKGVLVAGTNPELDAIQAATRAKGEKAKAGPRDAVLQRALDAIATIALFDSAGKKPLN